jgi:hypothetical protein
MSDSAKPFTGEIYYKFLARTGGHPDTHTPMMARWTGGQWELRVPQSAAT